MRLHVGDAACVFELLEDDAPSLTAALRRASPHASLAAHCQTAGAEFYVPLPFFHWYENRRVPEPGDVGYASFNNYLCVYYGAMDPDDGATNVVGRIVGDLDAARTIGASLLEQSALPARLAVDGDDGPEAPLPPLPEPTTAFSSVARAHLASTLGGIPDEIERLRRLPRLAMGNVPARFHASAALMAISDNLLVCRRLALDGHVPMGALVVTAATLARRSTRWLTVAGLYQSADVLRQLADWLETDGPPTAAAFVASIEEVQVALGRLRIWADAITPWSRLSHDYLPDSRWLGDLTAFNRPPPGQTGSLS